MMHHPDEMLAAPIIVLAALGTYGLVYALTWCLAEAIDRVIRWRRKS